MILFDASVLNDIPVSSKAPKKVRTLPTPGNYQIQLAGVGPDVMANGGIRKEYGKPLFKIQEFSIIAPASAFGDYKIWQSLPMTEVKEFGNPVNYLRDLARAYDDSAEFETAEEAFSIITNGVEDGLYIHARLIYQAEDFKGAQQTKIDEGLNVPFSQLTEEQVKRRNEIDRGAKVKGTKVFQNEDGTYNQQWTSPFGNVVPVRLAIGRFYNSSYTPELG